MKLGLINSAWVQANRPTQFGLQKTKEIGFDSIDIFVDPLDIDVKERRLHATLVAFGRDDFVLVTPDNHYMTTRNGLNGVAFRLGNRAVPFEQFDLRFHRPDLVLKHLGYVTPELVDDYRRLHERRIGADGDGIAGHELADGEIHAVTSSGSRLPAAIPAVTSTTPS